MEKLSKERNNFKNSKEETKEEDENLAEKMDVLSKLWIFKAIDYILIANYLIIDKINALIDLLDDKNKSDVNYGEVIYNLNKILKAKITAEKMSSVKLLRNNKI